MNKENESGAIRIRDGHKRYTDVKGQPEDSQQIRASLLLEGIEDRHRRDSEGQIDRPQIQRWAKGTDTDEIGLTETDRHADRLRSF